jgi:hypothetical protein
MVIMVRFKEKFEGIIITYARLIHPDKTIQLGGWVRVNQCYLQNFPKNGDGFYDV